MKRSTKSIKSTKTIGIVFKLLFIGGIIVGAALMYGYIFLSTSIGYGNLNPSNDYRIYVNTSVIEILNSEYTQDIEQAYCIDGTIDEVNKKVIINSITSLNLKSQTYSSAITSERFACSDKLGLIHTHPKYLNLFPTCEFSASDIYSLGESFGDSKKIRVNGVYCDKDKIAFYISNSMTNEEIFRYNRRLSYEIIN